MAVIRTEKNRNFTTMSNYHLRDKRLSLKTKGLMSVILSLPDDWNYSVRGLAVFLDIGESAVKSSLAELEACGYLTRNRLRKDDGTFGDIEYTIEEKPAVDNPIVDNPVVDNPRQLNTNIQNTKEQNTENKNIKPIEKKKLYGEYKNVRLTDSQYIDLQEDFPLDYDDWIDRLDNYLEEHPRKHYANHLQTIRKWAKKAGVARASAQKKKIENDYSEAEAFFDELGV